jgi:3-deoxy-D-manno-octulosonate 8-phosphate phosphatase (KDO 8-P phosphatase)
MSLKNIRPYLKNISPLQCISFDCEGVLTLNQRQIISPFDTNPIHHDDQEGLKKILAQKKFTIAIISKSQSSFLKKTLLSLGIQYVYMGAHDKTVAYEELKFILNLKDDQCCHMGDGEADIPLLKRVGFALTVPNAPKIVQEHADYCTKKFGGWGAVNEAIELILEHQEELH